MAFHAEDDPSQVQAPVVPRDQIWQGDWVGVSIDTYHDRQRSFFLCANPLGIQMDGVDQEGLDSDMAPDFQYTSHGRVTGRRLRGGDGDPIQDAAVHRRRQQVTFGFQAIRDIRRNGTHMYWAPVSRNMNSYHSQIGTMAGLDRTCGPGATWRSTPPIHHDPGPDGRRTASYDKPEGSFGIGVKVGLTSNLIADVDDDSRFQPGRSRRRRVDINERFAIFFPEKRPFFLEGSDIFNSPINLVYTRRIVDPRYGAKLTGKVGRTSVGVLSAADRSAGSGIDGLPDDVNPYLDHNAQYTIARFKQDVFKSSYVGHPVRGSHARGPIQPRRRSRWQAAVAGQVQPELPGRPELGT